ncbi:MAG TPA: FAD-dependent oxidoreductase, partial [Pyrinomonadaceae bacterium]|nr:FAD-dependent oxidoreductase [Pyrinomonadaceae bacterium]
MKRRNFIKQVLYTGAALSSLSVPLAGWTKPGRKGDSKRVIVIGAGLAGLSAAYELTQQGHDVIILEARTRPGGRVCTLREPFADGLYAEAGGMFINESYTHLMRYAENFNLPLDLLGPNPAQPDLALLYYIHGHLLKVKRGQKVEWPVALTSEEKLLGLGGIQGRYLSLPQDLGDTTDLNWPTEAAKKYDRMTYSEFLRSRGASKAAVELLRLGNLDMFGDGPDTFSALYYLRFFAAFVRSNSIPSSNRYVIKGGSDLLPEAFAKRLSGKIYYGAPVVRIDRSEQSVRVISDQAGARQEFVCDRLVCAAPFSVLKLIKVYPSWSAGKQQAIEQLRYTSVARVYLQSRKRFWLDEGVEGFAVADLPINRLIDHPLHQPGTRGILEANLAGPQARLVTAMKESERISFALDQAQKIHPRIRENFEGGVSKCWDEDVWARGAYSWFKPGEVSALVPHIARSEGRVHFAGEHTSAWTASMEGALESGNRVA